MTEGRLGQGRIVRLQLTDGVLDLDTAQVERIARLDLTPLEVRLLRHLARVAPEPVSNEDLLQAVWGYAPGARSRTVRVTVGRLRNKIEVDPAHPTHLVTVRGAGYRLDADPVRDLDLHPERTPGPLVGRDAELESARRRLHGGRWLTLLGAPGIGKSRLALQIAEEWPGPVAWFDCEPFANASAALGAIAARVGIRVGPGGVLEQAAADLLAQALAERVSLVVLDGIESHAVELAPLVERWARVEPLTVLATSRLPLGLEAESTLELGPLELQASIELIASRSGLDPSEAEPLARASDGVPLACELSAASARGVLPDDLTGERGLEAALERSWSLLGTELQRGLVASAAFEGAFDMAAARGVVGSNAAGLLHHLRLHGLLAREGRRIRMLRSVREPVAGRLPLVLEEARSAHAAYFGALAIRSGARFHGPERKQALDELVAARAELEAVLRWGLERDVELAAMVLGPLAYALQLRIGETSHAWEDALLARDPEDSLAVLRIRAAVLERTGTPEQRRELAERARQAGHHEIAARVVMRMGREAVLSGDMEGAAAIFAAALQQPAPPRMRARLLLGVGKVARARGEPCRVHYHAAVEALGDRIDPPLQGEIEMSLGREALDRGAVTEAREHFERALAIGRLDGDFLVVTPMGSLANAALVSGDLDAAIQGFERQEHLAGRMGHRRLSKVARIRAALARVERGDEEADDALTWAAGALEPQDSVELHGAVAHGRCLRALDQDEGIQEAFAAYDALELPAARALEREQLHAVRGWLDGTPVPADLVHRLLEAGQGSYARDLQALRAVDGDPDGERALRQLSSDAGPMFTAFQRWVSARRRGSTELPEPGAAGVLLRLALRRESTG